MYYPLATKSFFFFWNDVLNPSFLILLLPKKVFRTQMQNQIFLFSILKSWKSWMKCPIFFHICSHFAADEKHKNAAVVHLKV